MKKYIENLGWLPKGEVIPKDLEITSFQELKKLSNKQLTWKEIKRLEKIYHKCKKDITHKEGMSSLKLWVSGNVTLDYLKSAMISACPRHNILCDIHLSEYNQIAQPFLDKTSKVHKIKPNIFILYVDCYLHLEGIVDKEIIKSKLKNLQEDIILSVKLCKKLFNSTCIITTTPDPDQLIFGNLEEHYSFTSSRIIKEFNNNLLSLSKEENFITLNLSYWASLIGISTWRSARLWFKAKLAYSLDLNNFISDLFIRTVSSVVGKSKKCLVLDLDNTLWGGVVGDDGIEGIKIGNHDPVGETYQALQAFIKKLHARGVILAVSSKNDHKTAIKPFKNKKEMIIEYDDISVFKANWKNKADNIRNIAKELNIGLDSIVFLDDNPAERFQVYTSIPEVSVPELPEDPSEYPLALIVAGYFEAARITDEDKKRSFDYQSNQKRIQLREQAEDLESYLKALKMKLEISSIDKQSLSRAADLFAKTNQFNLSQIRFTETQLKNSIISDKEITYKASLKDKFGDSGIITALVISKEKLSWEIKNWVMSCRVFGRHVEHEIIAKIVKDARLNNIKLLNLKYIPTDKNSLLKNLLNNIGFKEINKNDSYIFYELELSNFKMIDSVFLKDSIK